MRVGGQQTPAIRIQVDPAKLVEKGLQLEDVRAQIGIATVNTPKGLVTLPTKERDGPAALEILSSRDCLAPRADRRGAESAMR